MLATWAEQVIDLRVRYFLSRRPQRAELERRDLVQDCLEHFWRQRHRYRPMRGASLATFVRTITDNYLLDLKRGWRAQRRGAGRRVLSLERPLADGDDAITLGDLQAAATDVEDIATGNAEAAYLLAQLSERQRQVLLHLEAGYRLAEVSRRLGIARTTLHDELLRLRDRFGQERR